ncbi:MAG TPA: TolC family protein [Thermoanaerobaculia bacterium]|jgi:outer membrane protein TolC
MKRLLCFRAVSAVLISVTFLLPGGVAAGQDTAAAATPAADAKLLSARPGERQVRPMPVGTEKGIPLSLEEAISLALSNNVDLDVSVNTAEASRFALTREEGIFDPLLTANIARDHNEVPISSALVRADDIFEEDVTRGGIGVSQLLPTNGVLDIGYAGNESETNDAADTVNPRYTSGLTASLTQPILRGFGWDQATLFITTSRNTQDAIYQDFVRAVQTTVNGVEQAYWDLVYALDNHEVKLEAKRVADDLNRITKIKIDVGSLAPIDIVQTEVGIAEAEQQIITAEGLIGDAQDRLKRLLNFDPYKWAGTPIVPTDRIALDTIDVDLAAAVRTAVQTRPEINRALYTIASQRARYEYFDQRTLPQLDFVGRYGVSGLAGVRREIQDDGTVIITSNEDFSDAVDNMSDGQANNWSVGLLFSLPIGNRSAKGLAGEAKYLLEANRANLSALEQNVVVEVRAAVRDIDQARRQVAAARKSRELAERNLEAERKKFENGMSTTFEVTRIQSDLSGARTLEILALAAYSKAVARYHYVIGDNLAWKGIRIEGIPESTVPDDPARLTWAKVETP